LGFYLFDFVLNVVAAKQKIPSLHSDSGQSNNNMFKLGGKG